MKLKEENQKISSLKNTLSNVKAKVDKVFPITFQKKEEFLHPSKTCLSKTNSEGIIEYVNKDFINISGYEEFELMGEPHSIVRHADMPKIIFKLIWDRLNKGEKIYAIIKNKTKSDTFYWAISCFSTTFDTEGNIKNHYSHRKAAPKHAVDIIEKLYKKIKSIERDVNPIISELFFKGYLENENLDYDDFILKILKVSKKELNSYFDSPDNKNRSFISTLFYKEQHKEFI